MSRSFRSFRRAYLACSALMALLIFSSLHALAELTRTPASRNGSEVRIDAIDIITPILAFAITQVPLRLKGGLPHHVRLATGISIAFACLTAVPLVAAYGYFVSTRGGEGPMGEGSPLAFILAMLSFGLIVFCPWLLTSLRGLRALREASAPAPADDLATAAGARAE